MNNKNWKKDNLAKFPVIPARISEIPGNSRREFRGPRFPGIPGNSRTGIPGGLVRRICSQDIRSVSALEVLRKFALYKSTFTYLLTYLLCCAVY